jgi:flagellar assembly factor FliW
MELTTSQYGKIEIEENNILEFKEGLIGFEEYQKFIIVSDKDLEPFLWLVSIDEPYLEFPIVNPFLFFPDYDSEITIESENETLFAIVSLKKEIENITINLKGPLLINIKEKTGKQIIINSEKYTPSYPLIILRKD